MTSLNSMISPTLLAPAGIVIARTNGMQTAAGLALLSHLANMPQGCSFEALHDVFLQALDGLKSPCITRQNLRGRLAHMAKHGYVVVAGDGRSGQQRLYRLGDLGRLPTRDSRAAARAQGGQAVLAVSPVQAGQPAQGAPAAQASPTGQRTPPAQYDLRRAPVYVPPPASALRAGSLDFQRIASYGYGC